jgi:hypothetical protein
MVRFHAITHAELMAEFAVGEDAVIVGDIVEPAPRGPRHQPRLRSGTRVRVRGLVGDGTRLVYLVEPCDPRGRRSHRWALASGGALAAPPRLGLLHWLAARLDG